VEKLSTYAFVGLPESIATALALICLSLALAPWLGGSEVGPLKVPKFDRRTTRWLRVAGPLGLTLFLMGFVRVWPSENAGSASLDFTSYMNGFFTPGKERLKGSLFVLNELETRQLREMLANSKWDGGTWGTVSFDSSGRIATYTNDVGRSPGRLLVQGAPYGTVPGLVAEWFQEDGQSGRALIIIGGESLLLRWGPQFSVDSLWRRVKASRD
jgi:hypothetical protein